MAKLTLELQETEVSLGKREFVLREMSANKQNKFYQLMNEYAQTEKRLKELRVVMEPTSEEVSELEKLAAKATDCNEKIWNMMLIPNDGNRERVSMEWLDENTNGRLGEKVIEEQLRLNDFDNTMGKLVAQLQPQAEALGVNVAPVQLGPTTAAPLADSIISTL